MSRRLVDALYVEAMVLADEARSYFDGRGDADRERLDVLARVSFSCESLKVTTRLMHIIAWLLSRRAVARGELSAADLAGSRFALGDAARSDPAVIAAFPFAARALIDASQDLYARVARMQAAERADAAELAIDPPADAVRQLLHRLENAF